MKSLSRIGFSVLLAAVFMAGCGGGGGGGTTTTATTSKFVGTQPPGDYWSWTITTDSSGAGNFTAVNNTKSLNYSGSVTQLTGNSAGISKLNVTSTTDTNVTVPAPAYAVEIPDTVLMVATAPFIMDNNMQESLNPPIFAAAQGSCPSTGADLIWITMPSASWCPTAGANNPQGGGCPSAGDAYGTASISVSGGTYTVNVTSNKLDGSPGSPVSLSSCTCSDGVIQCTDSDGNPARIAFTPSGVFFVDTSNSAIAGIVQPTTDIDLTDFLKNGRSFKGLRYIAVDSLASYGVSQNTQPVSITADGTQLIARPFSNIDNGTLNTTEGGSINFGGSSQLSPGLIRATLNDRCGGSSDMVMTVRKINDKYVGLIIAQAGSCSTYDGVGFNALMSEQ